MTAPNQKPSLEQQLVDDIAGFTHDPLGFVLYAFDWGRGELAKFPDGPDDWAREVLDDIGGKLRSGAIKGIHEAIQIATASGHGIGKSALVSWLILWAIATFEDTKGVVTANTDTQLRTKTWAELSKWYRLCIVKHWFKFTATSIFALDPEHEKTWRIDMVPWSVNNTEAFAGLHNQGKRILIVFDEASAIDDPIWEVTEGALTDEDTEIVWVAFGNPTQNRGRFRECFGRFKHRWSHRQIDSRTVKITNKEQIAKWVEDYGHNSDFVKVRVRGMFPSASAKQFISTTDVDAAFNRQLREDQYLFAPKILTCDPAWEGDDELVIGLRQGLHFEVLRVIAKNDNDLQVATILANLEDQHKADAVFIDAGYGTGIVSAGRTMGRDWQLIWFAGASSDAGCLNKRAEMWKLMRDWLKDGGAIPNDMVLYNDLIGPETVARADGKIQLESKKDMKGRSLASPGRGDALALSFAQPVVKRNPFAQFNSAKAREHDPYGAMR
ncbi:MAG TPA: terminase [Oxalobacteraceae bacterium]|nr:terminase [Oxalobacteraceae bacterium]